MKKKLSIGLAIMLTLVFTAFGLYSMNKAYAAGNEDYVVGTSNLHGTEENSAKIGGALQLPEKGWKRYDDTHPNIAYTGNRSVKSYSWYGGSATGVGVKSTANFRFTGTKLRVIVISNIDRSEEVEITIDGTVVDTISTNLTTTINQSVLGYEILSLTDAEHTVVITNKSTTKEFFIDALDIDEDGELHPYDIQTESISLDKTAIDLLKGNTDKLTATVLPENASSKKVVWSSSDETIATVDQEGNVIAVKSGQVDIIAKVDGTDLSATCKVIVTEKEPEPEPTPGKAILSISLVDGKTKDYDLSMEEVNKFINWYETKGSSTYKFDKNISPYKAVKEYIVHDKITSFEVREYE
ncbi:Ig-like domain-containing protein [Clostridium sp. UBA3887]|uniref:Ig-like domain-containing protein n=1 Tax=Clostridium sp. UBA3887 TaxID=1946356 RepID=UPI003216338C